MARIVVLDSISQDGLDLLEAAPGIEYEVKTGLKGEELRNTLMEFDGAICRSGVKLTADILEGNTRLKAIARAGVGTDNIDKTVSSLRPTSLWRKATGTKNSSPAPSSPARPWASSVWAVLVRRSPSAPAPWK